MHSCVSEENLRDLIQQLNADLKQCIAIRTMKIDAANRELKAANSALESSAQAVSPEQEPVEFCVDGTDGASQIRSSIGLDEWRRNLR